MRRFIKSKKGIALIATLVVLAIAGGAYAYLTTGGSGSGSATDGTVANLVIQGPCTGSADTETDCNANSSVSVGSGLLPGAANSVSVAYSIYNPNPSSVKVTSVVGTTSQSVPGCQALNSDFSYTDGSNGYPTTIPAHGVLNGLSGTLVETDSPTDDQTPCLAPNQTTVSLTSS